MRTLVYLVSHPIQYQAPLLRKLNAAGDLNTITLFRSNMSVGRHYDAGFRAEISWDATLLEGYPHQFLKSLGRSDRFSFLRPYSVGLFSVLRRERPTALWLHGYASAYHLYAILLARLLGILTIVRSDSHDNNRRRNVIHRFVTTAVFAYMRLMKVRFLPVGSANKRRYISFGVRENSMQLMPYAVDNDFFSVRGRAEKRTYRDRAHDQLGTSRDRPIILFAGKLQYHKRWRETIQAFSAPGVWDHPTRPILVVAGSGVDTGSCFNEAKSSVANESIFLLGFKSQEELAALYKGADLFAMIADREAWGLAVNEAMAAGCAILGSRQLGCAEDLVREGRNGWLCDSGDVEGAAILMREALSSEETLAQMGEQSRKIIANWGLEQDVSALRCALSAWSRT